jgi:protein-S-isoprenylcysteine O-methyltransferase Ste14
VAFVLGMMLRYDAGTGKGFAIAAAAIGLVTLLVGLFAQMMSATRQERILLVTGMVAGFVGLALGLAHGGFAG